MLRVLDHDDLIEFNFSDLRKYHGTRSICGLTVAYTIMRAAFKAMAGEQPIDRATIAIATAFPGPGARDGFELVTRVVSRDRYSIDTSVAPSAHIAQAAKGAYYFRFSGKEGTVALGLRPQVLPQGFIDLRRKQLDGVATAAELEAFRGLQLELSDGLLSLHPSDAVNILS